jgi:hypothetical protein
MADSKISALTAMTVLAAADEFVIVDKSDTAQAASGSTRRLPLSVMMADPVFIAYLTGNRANVEINHPNQAINSGTTTDLAWTSETADNDGWITTPSPTLTVPAGKAGMYLVSYSGSWATAALGTITTIDCLHAGTAWYGANGVGNTGKYTFSFALRLAAGDTLKFRAFQNSGIAVSIAGRLIIVPLPVT